MRRGLRSEALPRRDSLGLVPGWLARQPSADWLLARTPTLAPRPQIERFACLYTSHVANFLFYSPNKNYKARPDTMCHEDDLAA